MVVFVGGLVEVNLMLIGYVMLYFKLVFVKLMENGIYLILN